MRKFESHLTAHIKDAAAIEDLCKMASENMQYPLKFSKIEGDALLGAKPYCYITTYDIDAQHLLNKMIIIEDQLKAIGIETLRIKIEEIIYDTKTGVNNL